MPKVIKDKVSTSGCGCDKRKNKEVHGDCGCEEKQRDCRCKKEREFHRQLPNFESACGNKKDCGENCCVKIAWIGNATGSATLEHTVTLLPALRRKYPSIELETAFVPAPSSGFGDGDSNAKADIYFAGNSATLFQLEDLVENYVCRGFKYIGLPESNSETLIFLTGKVGTHELRPGGNLASVDFPGVTFLVLSNVNSSVANMGNVVQFTDSASNNDPALISANLVTLVGKTNPSKVVLDLVFESEIGSNDPATFISGPIAAYEAAAISLGYTVVKQSIHLTSPGVYNTTDLTTVANEIASSLAAGNTKIVAIAINGSTQDQFNSQAKLIVSPNPFFNTGATYFGVNYGIVAGGASVPVTINSGLSVIDTLPSSGMSALGFSSNLNTVINQNSFGQAGIIRGIVYASNCKQVHTEETGLEMKTLVGSNQFVSQWLLNSVIPANTTASVLSGGLFQNPLYGQC